MKAVEYEQRIRAPDDMVQWRRELPAGDTVAVVAGTFDILQPGNLRALALARRHARHVAVVLEPDALAAGHSGTGRPQHDVLTRAEFLSHVRGIGAITSIEAEGAAGLFACLRPYVLLSCTAQRTADPLAAPAAAAAERVVALAAMAGCFTEDIHAAIRRDATPVMLPEGVDWSLNAGAPSEPPGVTTVTVNGCFDILHIGHVRFLAQAREHGDRLVVLVNDAASVRHYKGATRPVFPLAFRAAALRALESVVDVCAFGEDKPLDLLGRIKPRVHVKGGSYEPDRVQEEQRLVEGWGGKLAFAPLVEGYSTSAYIRKALGVPSTSG